MLSQERLDEFSQLSHRQKIRTTQILLDVLAGDEADTDDTPLDESRMSEEKRQLVAEMRESIRQAFSGETYPIEDLARMLDEEDDDDDNEHLASSK
jgi:hypothetical protein